MSKTVTISQLDTGYLIKSEESEHGITSKNDMIAKVHELFDISQPKQAEMKETPATIPTKQKLPTPLQFGILSALVGTWPINTGDYIVPDAVSIPNNEKVTYFETFDGRILIQYRTHEVYTTFDEIKQLLDISPVNKELKHIPRELPQDKKTGIKQFMIAVRNGLKSGDSVDLDPDKDFRPILNRPSTIEHERGTLKQVSIED